MPRRPARRTASVFHNLCTGHAERGVGAARERRLLHNLESAFPWRTPPPSPCLASIHASGIARTMHGAWRAPPSSSSRSSSRPATIPRCPRPAPRTSPRCCADGSSSRAAITTASSPAPTSTTRRRGPGAACPTCPPRAPSPRRARSARRSSSPGGWGGKGSTSTSSSASTRSRGGGRTRRRCAWAGTARPPPCAAGSSTSAAGSRREATPTPWRSTTPRRTPGRRAHRCPVRAHGLAAAEVGGRLHVLGADLHLRLEGGAWRKLAPLGVPRIFFCAVALEGRLLALGVTPPAPPPVTPRGPRGRACAVRSRRGRACGAAAISA